MLFAFIIIWLSREIKAIFFWLFLWQVKEYRLERFIDHFRTAKGKKVLFDPVLAVKIILFGALFLDSRVMFIVVLVYGAEIFLRRTLRPSFTKKVIALFGIVTAATFLFVANLIFFDFHPILQPTNAVIFLLAYDILTPVIVSAVVVGLQPFTILVRNRRLAKAKAKQATFKNLKVVGITGSYGKTSTKEFLAHILSSKYKVLKTPEHQNSEFGVANTILNKLTKEHEVFVCEMGAYKKGEIKALAEVAQPHIGIVTGVNEQHLATFGSMENLLSAEGGKELVDLLPENGAAFINQKVQKRGVGYDADCKVSFYGQAENIKVEKDNVSFELEGVKFTVPAYGGHNIENLLGAIGAARELGMSLEEIAKAAQTMPLELSPLKVKKTPSGATVIDSTYSANPDGVIADLDYLNLYEGTKVIIMPCLIELGKASKKAHTRIGQKIAEVCDLAIITTQEHFADIKQGAGNSEKVIYMETADKIIEKIKSSSDEGLVVLLEGGKESRTQLALLRSIGARVQA